MAEGPYRLIVIGTPVPKGSLRAFVPKGWTRPVVTSDNTASRPWALAVQDAAMRARGVEMGYRDGPVTLVVDFFLPRPKSAPKRILMPSKKPDADKLVRCILDALTGILWRDDAQVQRIVARKHFAAGAFDPQGQAGVPRATILVYHSELTPRDGWVNKIEHEIQASTTP